MQLRNEEMQPGPTLFPSRAEREEIDADKDEEKELEEITKSNKPVFDPANFYNREVLAITVDYLQLKRLAKAR